MPKNKLKKGYTISLGALPENDKLKTEALYDEGSGQLVFDLSVFETFVPLWIHEIGHHAFAEAKRLSVGGEGKEEYVCQELQRQVKLMLRHTKKYLSTFRR